MFNSEIHLGLDISDFRLRLVAIRKSFGNLKIHGFGEMPLPQGVVVNGSIEQPEQLVELLKQLPKNMIGGHLQDRDVNVGLPEQQTFLTTFPIDLTDQSTMEQEALRNLPFNEEDMYFEVEAVKNRQAVAVAAGRKEFIDYYIKVLEKANYRPTGLYAEVIAMSKALLYGHHSEGGVVIIDLGQARTTTIFYIDRHVYFSTSYPSIVDQGQINQDNLNGVVQQLLGYYMAHFQERAALEKIVLCGSGAHAPQISAFIAQLTGVPTELGDPFSGIKESSILKKMDMPLGYTTAIGLALL